MSSNNPYGNAYIFMPPSRSGGSGSCMKRRKVLVGAGIAALVGAAALGAFLLTRSSCGSKVKSIGEDVGRPQVGKLESEEEEIGAISDRERQVTTPWGIRCYYDESGFFFGDEKEYLDIKEVFYKNVRSRVTLWYDPIHVNVDEPITCVPESLGDIIKEFRLHRGVYVDGETEFIPYRGGSLNEERDSFKLTFMRSGFYKLDFKVAGQRGDPRVRTMYFKAGDYEVPPSVKQGGAVINFHTGGKVVLPADRIKIRPSQDGDVLRVMREGESKYLR